MAMHNAYITALCRLELEVNRELDRAQVGAPLGEGLIEAWQEVRKQRIAVRLLRQAEGLDSKPQG